MKLTGPEKAPEPLGANDRDYIKSFVAYMKSTGYEKAPEPLSAKDRD